MSVFESFSWKIALTSLFGATIFIIKLVLPFPVDKFLVGFQALFLALGLALIFSI